MSLGETHPKQKKWKVIIFRIARKRGERFAKFGEPGSLADLSDPVGKKTQKIYQETPEQMTACLIF